MRRRRGATRRPHAPAPPARARGRSTRTRSCRPWRRQPRRRRARDRPSASPGSRRPAPCAAPSRASARPSRSRSAACSEATTTLRPVVCRAAISAASVDVDAVSSMWPCQPSGSPSSCRTQSTTRSSSSVDAGEARQRIATWFSVAASSSARIPGSEAVVANQAKKRGCCQFVSAGTISSSRSRRMAANGSGCSGGAAGSRALSSPGCTCARHGQLGDPLEVARRPLERRLAVTPEIEVAHGRCFRSLSSCRHVRVFATSSAVSQPRRACPTASST